ncbi:hypothetical protein AAEO50_07405 [Rossellomorea oryzaecorticis]|uniref:Uncharacterized protein n=1 Tax=Rossellomorea oryzaecorticis TaxID=1396505 RepID=A0ABU9K7N5_9BACI
MSSTNNSYKKSNLIISNQEELKKQELIDTLAGLLKKYANKNKLD